MKTEPDTFSIDDLERVGVEPWNGVRNYQARNHMRAMQPGDGVFLYHSSCAVPGIAGMAKVATAAYPDPTQFDKKSDYYDPKSTREEPRWSLVDVAFERKLAQRDHAGRDQGACRRAGRGFRARASAATACPCCR